MTKKGFIDIFTWTSQIKTARLWGLESRLFSSVEIRKYFSWHQD